jgi:hypothetical protein
VARLVLAYAGFNFGGWVTGGNAAAMAKDPLPMLSPNAWEPSVAQFNRDPEKSRSSKK